jgi:excinuclease ABC subunit C
MVELKDKIKTLPLTSGVYIYKDADGNIIYVGKAVSLRKRVTSYLRPTGLDFKTSLLVKNIKDVEVIETASEAEALLLEASLVKQHQPKFNIELKDDKSYPYIQITREEYPLISLERFHPRELIGENKRKVDGVKADLFGPYIEPRLIREALGIIRKIFPFRTCQPMGPKVCLDHHIGLCDAPCEVKISKEDYGRNIRSIRMILDGRKDDLYKSLYKDMEELAKNKEFEAASKVRDQIRAIGALYSSSGDKNYFKEAEQLQRALDLPKIPERIECFDISNIMGNQATGSMVSFFNGKPDKNNYRRFKIKTVKGIDDFQMIAEVVRRRYTRLKNENKMFPDLILIDGGKGQLASAVDELKKLGVDIPIASLAKQEEELFVPGKRSSVILAKDSLGLRLVQRVRDEAHRFALKYHRLLRDKNVYQDN